MFSESEYESARDRLNLSGDSQVTPGVIAERKAGVRDLADRLAETGVDVTAHGRLSNGTSRGERLAQVADEVDADVIIVGGRSRSPIGKALFGSTSRDVMLESARPVTFVRAA